MAELTRRGFLKTSAGIAGAAAGVTAVGRVATRGVPAFAQTATNGVAAVEGSGIAGRLAQWTSAQVLAAGPPPPYTDAVSYGADNTGATDSTAAMNAALTAAGPIGIVYLHSGVYRVSGTIALGYGQTLLGAGHYETWVYTTAPTGDVFTLNTGSTIKGMFVYGANTTATAGGTLSGTGQTIATGTLANGWPSSGTGTIALTNGSWTTITWTGATAASLTGCKGSGAFSAGAVINVRSADYAINDLTASVITIDDMWIMNMYNGLRLTGVDVLFTNSWVYNVVNYSVVVAGTNSAPFLDNVTLAWSTGNKPLAHMEVQACGNLVMVDCQCVQGTYGMDVSPTGSGVFSLYCSNSFFDSCVTAGLNIQPGANVVRCKFDQCWFCTAVNGVVMNNTSIAGLDFDNCEISNNSANGFLVTAAADWSVTHSRAAGNTVAGINVAASPTTMKFHISDCQIGAVNPGFGANATGIVVASGTYGSYTIVDNDLLNNTKAMSDAGTATNGKIVAGNSGLSVAPLPMIATPAAVGTTETVAHQMSLPANSLLVGTTIRVLAHGIAIGTGPTILPRLRIGTAGTTSDTQVCATTAAAITSGTGWAVEAYITIRSLGSGGTALGNIKITGDNLLTAMRASAQTATVPVNTAVANFLSFTLRGGGSGIAITVVNAFAEVVRQ